jgi:hypothetical protein
MMMKMMMMDDKMMMISSKRTLLEPYPSSEGCAKLIHQTIEFSLLWS